jgi:large repetitive protein
MSRTIRLLVVGAALFLGVVIPQDLAHAATFTVNTAADAVDANPGNGTCATAAGNCTLRAAVQEANATAGEDWQTIDLPAGTYTLTITGSGDAESSDLDILDNLRIHGAGSQSTIIDGNGASRVLEIG